MYLGTNERLARRRLPELEPEPSSVTPDPRFPGQLNLRRYASCAQMPTAEGTVSRRTSEPGPVQSLQCRQYCGGRKHGGLGFVVDEQRSPQQHLRRHFRPRGRNGVAGHYFAMAISPSSGVLLYGSTSVNRASQKRQQRQPDRDTLLGRESHRAHVVAAGYLTPARAASWVP